MSFKSLGLSEEINRAVQKMGYKEPFKIQTEAIPVILSGSNVIALAKTGSGKTAAFVLPILQKLLNQKKVRNIISVLILVPTRELALQVDDEIAKFGAFLGNSIKHKVVFGGVSINPQMTGLRTGADILVATPGRLLDLMGRNAVNLNSIHTVVFDEADRMLDMGFSKDIKKISSQFPLKKQTLLFSATMDKEVMTTTLGHYHNSVIIGEEEEKVSVDQIDQCVYFVEASEKMDTLISILNSNEVKQVLVFSSMKHHADSVGKKLLKAGIMAEVLHGDKSQGARVRALTGFKNGTVRVLIATDLASRGIDIIDLPLVINYELPRSPADYIHRIGRTGRAGKNGKAISLVCPDEKAHMKLIEKRIGKTVRICS